MSAPMEGLFKLHDTHGFSLTDSTVLCLERGIYPNFYLFCLDAIKAGWKPRKIYTVIREAMIDSGLPADDILPKVELVLKWKFED